MVKCGHFKVNNGIFKFRSGSDFNLYLAGLKGNKNGCGNKGKILSEERKISLRKPRSNPVKPLTQEHTDNISKSHKGRITKRITCPYCNKIGGISQMKQWHFDRCKYKQ